MGTFPSDYSHLSEEFRTRNLRYWELLVRVSNASRNWVARTSSAGCSFLCCALRNSPCHRYNISLRHRWKMVRCFRVVSNGASPPSALVGDLSQDVARNRGRVVERAKVARDNFIPPRLMAAGSSSVQRPTRASGSRTRSSNQTIVARCSVSAVRSSPTSSFRVATIDGTTQQNVEGIPSRGMPV